MWKALELKKFLNQIKFEGIWGKLEAKICFQKQSFTRYLRQALVFMVWSSEGRGGIQLLFFSIFWLLAAGLLFSWGEGLGAGLKLYVVLRFFWIFLISEGFKSQIVPCLLLKFVPRFTCGERKVSWNIKKVSKYYENDCRLNFKKQMCFLVVITTLF